MKNFKSILLLLMLAVPIMVYATQSSDPGKPCPLITLIKGKSNGHTNRPKAPDRQVVTCYYDGEDIFLNLVYNEGMATLSIRDQLDHEEIYYVDTSNLRIQLQVGRLVGSIYIQLETETNKLYEGILE